MLATATATDPLGLAATGTRTVTTGGATGIRTVRAGLLENRVIWGSLATPGYDTIQGPTLTLDDFIQAPAGPITLAITFTMQRAANITGCRIYKHPSLTGTIPVALWNSAGTVLASTTVSFIADHGGWRTVTFPAPAAVVNGSEYTVGYFSAGDNYVYSAWVFNAQDTYVYPFLVKSYSETGGTKANGAARHQAASLTFPNVPGDRTPANYYIDPIAEWTDTLPGYTGGTAYYDQFIHGGSSFNFPVGVFFADPENLAGYKALGVNTLIAGGASDFYIETIKSTGMDWYPTIGDGDMTAPVVVQEDATLAPRVRGYLLTDEPDLNTPYNPPATLKLWRDACRRIDSTRPIILNLSYNPVKNQGFTLQPPGAGMTAWNQSWIDYAALSDVLSCDFYSLAASDSFDRNALPGQDNRYGLWAYPPQVRRMAELCESRVPIWGYVETTSQLPGLPTPQQVDRAAWSMLIAGARGLILFDHRAEDADVTQDFATILHNPAMGTAISTLAAQLQTLAPALLAAEAGLVTAYTSSNTLAAATGGYAFGANIPIHHTTRIVGGSTYLFVQAIRPGQTTATVSIPSLPSQAWAVTGGGTITANSTGTLTIPLTDGDYSYKILTATAVPVLAAPVATAAPAIIHDGTPTTGETVTATTGGWSGYPTPVFTYQWRRNGVNVTTGSTSAGYVLQAADEGTSLTVRVTASNSQGTAGATSAPISPTAPAAPSSPYATRLLSYSPIGYWRLEDLTDSSGNGLTLTTLAGTGMTTTGSLLPTEPSSSAKHLDGSTWLGHADDPILKPTAGITMIAWVKPDTIGAFAIFSKNGHALRLQSNGHFQAHFWQGTSGGGDLSFEGTTVATTTQTYMVAATYEGTIARLYVNGVEDANFPLVSPINNISTAQVMVGGQASATGWVGTIDEVAFIGRAITAAEIAALYDPSGGWPDATTTGVPAGTTLTTVTGDIDINTNGQLYENKTVNGTLTVNGDNVTIRNCRINVGGIYGIASNGANLLIEDCEINGGNVVGHTGVTDRNYTIRRCNIHGCDNQVWAQQNVLIEDCFIHDNVPYDPILDPHTDGVQMPDGANNVTIQHNTIWGDFRWPDIAHGGPDDTGFGNSAITTGSSMANITIHNNLLSGGGYSLRLAVTTPGTSIVVTNNRWTNQPEAAAGWPTFYAGFGSIDGGCPGNATTWTDNLYYDGPNAGAPVV
jgi:hypothetical protein